MGSGSSKASTGTNKETGRVKQPVTSITDGASKINQSDYHASAAEKQIRATKLDVNLNLEKPVNGFKDKPISKKHVPTNRQAEIESEDSDYGTEDLLTSTTFGKDRKKVVSHNGDLSNKTEQRDIHKQSIVTTNSDKEEYPESYAQRKLREQYTQNQLLRQKTIYRDPDEWEIEEEDEKTHGFDPLKFKNVNQEKVTDIFATQKGPSTKIPQTTKTSDLDFYYETPQKTEKNIPKYDNSEEELMADIEKEFGNIF